MNSTKEILNQSKEMDLLLYIAEMNSSYSEYQQIVKILDNFIYMNLNKDHFYIIFELLRESALNLQKQSENGRLSVDLLQRIAQQTLLELNYLHHSCRLVYTNTQH